MKIAVIADIHANLEALRRVVEDVEAWRPDQVVILGDVVNRGPRPAECLALVLEKARSDGWFLVRGNHEEYVITVSSPDAPHHGIMFEVHRPSYWTYTQLGRDVQPLLDMPLSRRGVDSHNRELDFYHGSILGLRDGIYPETSDEELSQKIGLDRREEGGRSLGLFCVGHTHRALIRSLAGVLVVNAGSAGLPFDGDMRAAYARLSETSLGWNAEIVRLMYDLKAAENDFYSTGYFESGGPLIRLVRDELRYAKSHLYSWAHHYQDAVLRGEISLEESVHRHLRDYQ